MKTHVSQLTAEDELLVHQHHDTFASVSSSDPAWTERVYGWAGDTGGEVAVAFGISRYINRNVADGYGLVAIGKKQYSIRASRRLYPEPNTVVVGPLRYEVVEPLKAVRCILEPTDEQPIAFDVTLRGSAIPHTEHHTARQGYRRSDDATRYMQIGRASGFVEVDGRSIDLKPDASISIRDHSWGIRSGIGRPTSDEKAPTGIAPDSRYRMLWTPGRLEGTSGEMHVHLAHWQATSKRGCHDENTTTIISPAGDLLHADTVHWNPAFLPDGSLQRIDVEVAIEDGSVHEFDVSPVGASRVFLGPALYGGFRGRYHGEDRGRLNIEGELIADTTDPAIAAELHQLSQEVGRITDRSSGATGWCGIQYELVGRFPEYGLPERLYR